MPVLVFSTQKERELDAGQTAHYLSGQTGTPTISSWNDELIVALRSRSTHICSGGTEPDHRMKRLTQRLTQQSKRQKLRLQRSRHHEDRRENCLGNGLKH